MNVAIYARVATTVQNEADEKLNAQVQEIETWAKENGHVIVNKYLDRGTSALDYGRPDFQRLISDAQSQGHPFDAIAVTGTSRLFREPAAYEIYKRLLEHFKVTIISIADMANAPKGDMDAAYLLKRIIAEFDDYSCRQHGIHIRRCMLESAKQGFFNSSRAPFGYMAVRTNIKSRNGFKRKLELDVEEAEIVRLIFSLATRGTRGEPMEIINIVEHLNKAAYRYRGKEFTAKIIKKLLSSPIYCGDRILSRFSHQKKSERPGEEKVTVKVTPIVSKEEFESVAVWLHLK